MTEPSLARVEMRTSELLECAAPYNPRKIGDAEMDALRRSIRTFGLVQPVIFNLRTRHVVGGHQRVIAAGLETIESLPVEIVDLDLTAERQLNLALNKISGQWDEEKLRALLNDLAVEGADLSLTGFSEDELRALLERQLEGEAGERPTMADRFGVPPFSVLDARQGYWKERKARWLSLGIESEIGRGGNLLGMSETMLAGGFGTKNMAFDGGTPMRGDAPVQKAPLGVYAAGPGGVLEGGNGYTGTSIFDPVLCELIYRWFCPKGGVVLDPFAGGSVRGVIAGKLERAYVGIDLRQEQIDANRAQAEKICDEMRPQWLCGDSLAVLPQLGAEYDLVFSCPPYADLERYSDDPRDLSTLDYGDFEASYRQIIHHAVSLLRPDRFACFVVGEVRAHGGGGAYHGLVPDTVAAFEEAGAAFYNEMILVTAVGTLPLRAGRTFSATRKVGKTHQNVLVFCKGDPRAATEACGEIEVELPELGGDSEDFGEPL